MNKTPQLRALSSTLRQWAAFLRAQAALETNRSKRQKFITSASELNKAANNTNAKTNNIKKGLNRLANIKKRKTALLSKIRARELEKKRAALARQTMEELKAVSGTATAVRRNRTATAARRNATATGTARRNGTASTVRKIGTATGTVRKNATASRTVRKR